MPRKKETDKNQLLLEFTERRDNLKRALEEFEETSGKLAAQYDGGNPETPLLLKEKNEETRAAVRRMVGVLSRQSGLPFDSLWVLAYHELHKKTDFHAVAASQGKGTHLDAVEAAGKLPELQETVGEMLTDPRFAAKG